MLVSSVGVLLSYNGGETWMDPMPGPITYRASRAFFGAFPTVALDENNFYKIANRGIARSTDGGVTWHPFMTGMVNSHVPSLVIVENVLYALTPTEMLKSADGGESWEAIGLNAKENTSFEGAKAKVTTANGVLYASNSERDGVHALSPL